MNTFNVIVAAIVMGGIIFIVLIIVAGIIVYRVVDIKNENPSFSFSSKRDVPLFAHDVTDVMHYDFPKE